MDHSTGMEENKTYGLSYDPMWKEKYYTARTKSLERKTMYLLKDMPHNYLVKLMNRLIKDLKKHLRIKSDKLSINSYNVPQRR